VTDTTDRTIRRPSVPKDLDDELASAVTEHVRVPADRLTFADRVRILLDEYEKRGDDLDELQDVEATNAALRDELAEAKAEVEELKAELADSRRGLVG